MDAATPASPPHPDGTTGNTTARGSLTIHVAGETLILLPHRAVYWPAQRTLLIADLHLDKCETMRVQGLPVPRMMDEQIARLDAALLATGARRILVLGDLLHAPQGLTAPMVECFAAWRATSDVEFALVPGNHDRGLIHVVQGWRMLLMPAQHAEGPFTFTHEPRSIPGTYVWSGHLHPAVTLRSASDAIKMPCFCVGPSVGVLPAFSRFTAGGSIGRCRGDQVFAIADGEVLAL